MSSLAEPGSYPGNPALPREVREKILSTFRHTLNLFKEGKLDDCLIGCDFILKMDPRFTPARQLIEKSKNPAADVDVADLESLVSATPTRQERVGLGRDGPAARPRRRELQRPGFRRRHRRRRAGPAGPSGESGRAGDPGEGPPEEERRAAVRSRPAAGHRGPRRPAPGRGRARPSTRCARSTPSIPRFRSSSASSVGARASGGRGARRVRRSPGHRARASATAEPRRGGRAGRPRPRLPRARRSRWTLSLAFASRLPADVRRRPTREPLSPRADDLPEATPPPAPTPPCRRANRGRRRICWSDPPEEDAASTPSRRRRRPRRFRRRRRPPSSAEDAVPPSRRSRPCWPGGRRGQRGEPAAGHRDLVPHLPDRHQQLRGGRPHREDPAGDGRGQPPDRRGPEEGARALRGRGFRRRRAKPSWKCSRPTRPTRRRAPISIASRRSSPGPPSGRNFPSSRPQRDILDEEMPEPASRSTATGRRSRRSRAGAGPGFPRSAASDGQALPDGPRRRSPAPRGRAALVPPAPPARGGPDRCRRRQAGASLENATALFREGKVAGDRRGAEADPDRTSGLRARPEAARLADPRRPARGDLPETPRSRDGPEAPGALRPGRRGAAAARRGRDGPRGEALHRRAQSFAAGRPGVPRRPAFTQAMGAASEKVSELTPAVKLYNEGEYETAIPVLWRTRSGRPRQPGRAVVPPALLLQPGGRPASERPVPQGDSSLRRGSRRSPRRTRSCCATGSSRSATSKGTST